MAIATLANAIGMSLMARRGEVTTAVVITTSLHHLLRRTRWLWASITVVIGLASYPAFALVALIGE